MKIGYARKSTKNKIHRRYQIEALQKLVAKNGTRAVIEGGSKRLKKGTPGTGKLSESASGR